MSKQKRSKLTASVTPDRTIRPKPFVQIEGELTEEQLEAISKRSAFGSALAAYFLPTNPQLRLRRD